MVPISPHQATHAGIEPAVFINCPYDAAFAPLFDAIVFACVCYGFLPRSAIDSGSSGTTRIERILVGLLACPYSIHDLSRCRGEGQENLARFNMPLELGMAILLTRMATGGHEWMALAPEGARYDEYASDLAGFDLERHDGSVPGVVTKVSGWLLTRPAAVASDLTPRDIVTALPSFTQARDDLVGEWLGGSPPWAAIVRLARELVPGG
jgi:hypothetical protein